MLTPGRFLTGFIILYLWGGLLLYNCLPLGFIDEGLVAALLLYTLLVRRKGCAWVLKKEFCFFLLLSLFYVVYSCVLGITSIEAILLDYQQEIKPYVTFYCAYMLGATFTSRQCLQIRLHCLLIFVVALFNLPAYGQKFMGGHPATLATASTTLFLYYFYFSNRSSKKQWCAWLMFTPGWISGRSKFFATYIASAVLWRAKKKIDLHKKSTLLVIAGTVLLIGFVIWEKFSLYILSSITGGTETARASLYITAFFLLKDFFPFGCGLGTYANHASRVYYSPLYEEYGLSKVFGLSPEMPDFIADTYYPVLAQFGVVGIVFFYLFWRRRYLGIKKIPDLNEYKVGLVILLVAGIESFADTTLLSNRGVGYCLLLGILLGKYASTPHTTT